MLRSLLGLCILWFLPLNAPAVHLTDGILSRYRLDGWQAEQGLPSTAVQVVLQARNGTLWVGTGTGLARFDGLQFRLEQDLDAPALSRRPIFGLMEDRNGRIWVGHGAGASRWNGRRWETLLDADQIKGRRVWSFVQAPDGSVWGASEAGLLHWTGDRLRHITPADGLPVERLRTLALDRDGTLWIGSTGAGLLRLREGRFESVPRFPHTEVRHLLADPEGGVWAATPGAGLVRVHPDGQWQRYDVDDGLPTDQLTSLARDREGNLWIGTWGAGVTRWREGQFQSLTTESGLGGDQVWTVHADPEGSLWMGSWNGGLNRLRPRSFPILGKPEGLAGDNVRSVLQARDGSLWVNTSGGGVSRLQGQRIQTLGLREGLPTLELSTLYEDADGAIWMGSYTAGLARWMAGRMERFGTAAGLPHVDVRSLLRDRQGTLWVGTRAGLARGVGPRFEAVHDAQAPQEGVVAMLEAQDGTLWFATTGDGLVRYRDGRFSRLTREDGLPSNWILALHEDADGALWIGSNGEGLARLKNDQIRVARVSDGLWDGLAQVFLPDAHDRLWMTCNRGFYWVQRRELNDFLDGKLARVPSTGYGVGEALRATTFAGGLQSAGARDAHGRLWLPSLKGLVRVDPEHLPRLGLPPAVRLEAISLGGQAQPLQSVFTVPAGATPPLTLRFAAATVQHAERVRFRYRMEGMTPGWVDLGPQREASFPVLPHGQYRLHVAASLDGETWQESTDLVRVTVAPRFFERRDVQALGGVLGLALLALGVQFRTRQLRQRQRDMERVVAEKTEALRRANEHLEQLSFSDALTGLSNRRWFDEQLAREWRRCARAREPLALVLADIDAFKAYNDSVGHAAGDDCLRAVSRVIQQHSGRAADCAARYGGEEFVLLLPGLDLPAARAAAEHLRAACQAQSLPHPASPVGPVVTLSLGVAACIPDPHVDPLTLFNAADTALYQAKQSGRNQVA
ncbi:ligand-binding sensor domain-containing diguanylate cyclase [Inhella gelatinilytica]|uniref:diguanylate cyclase n=1 Tax=Inhella gelatinilytica TaxID=2795030 RepID=A0A931NDE1_9BURK|nr:two-component regulator propeller domain-containing protein [Inhella gelatinilytica]MBH9552140.1 diguanylate cyclase [Inhella gelatinilytica]